MTRLLYDLALGDAALRPSAYCWIVKFALLHKGLAFETFPVPFADKSKYPDPDYGKVPVLVDDGEMVKDSPVITLWLDKKHPENPLTATKAERAAYEFYSAWLAASLYPALAPALMLRLHDLAAAEDRAYFRKTREARFGRTLEELAATPRIRENVEAALGVLAAPLSNHRFLGGLTPNLCDYAVMGPLMWQRTATAKDFYEAPPPVAAWRERMLDLFDGYARKAKRPSQ
ncbi:MAG: glutathione S-transferase N-terminal domain-containing protein [Parvularculaceae bacterium]